MMRYAKWAVVVVAVVAAATVGGQPFPEDTNEIRTLTVKQAQDLAQREGMLYLNGLTSLSPDVADAIAEH